MGEAIPFIAAFVLLAAICVAILWRASSRKAVVRPLNQEDVVHRVKIRVTGAEAIVLSTRLLEANYRALVTGKSQLVEFYEGGNRDRLISFDVTEGKAVEAKAIEAKVS